jgi:adenosylcobinamide kinase/adenosylcobinamide-phosphate guanylyltransferase
LSNLFALKIRIMPDINKKRIIFCTGGIRSGKSAYALRLAADARSRVFIATAEGRDEEMRQRILAHKKERGPEWQTLEVPASLSLELPALVRKALGLGEVLVLDCLSTWVSGCMEALAGRNDRSAQSGADPAGEILGIFAQAIGILKEAEARAVLVSAETGLGLVPLDAEARLFVDVLGKVNQLAAASSDEAYFLVSALPLRLK